MRADQKIGACDADNLFIDGKFPVDAVGVTIASGEGVLARGTVVAMSSKTKKCVILGTAAGGSETLTPFGVLRRGRRNKHRRIYNSVQIRPFQQRGPYR